MATEDLKEPLMDDEDRSSMESDWVYSLKLRTAQQKNRFLRRILLSSFIALPWILLVLLGILSWNALYQYKTKYYVRPDLTYSKKPSIID